ncbi:PREDICTED: L-type lectin-domain containing receptor kinase S.6 [Populus euphratica]|uniref:non-specific serine/threonine protein kinase n=1 Tax=Populus euphratica TaxID=75702 RepID=A0AAJ6WZ42_POPEU|nr:PREDICTED: L-type lectin-domain containing receptor kinase S.6 [Populus euphratica]
MTDNPKGKPILYIHFDQLRTADRNVTLYGDAHLRNNAISLTQQHTCPVSSSSSSSSNGVGKALYLYPIRFLDPITNTTASFFCRFSFSIIRSPLSSFGDGMAFLITSNADSFSLSKGYMGLPEPALNPQDSFIAVEFDTSSDPSLGDISSNHIGIDANTIVSLAAIDAVSVGIDLQSGRQITAWIEYSDSSKLIQVWVSYFQVRPPSPILVAQVDLSQHFKEYMHVGFSASNGQGSAVHIVDHWRFKTYATLSSVTPRDTSEKGDCLMCYAENPKYNYGPGTQNGRKKKLLEMALGLGGLAAFTVSIIVVLFVIIFFAIKKRKGVGGRTKEGRINRVPRSLSITEIRSATMGFHRSRIIGQGASATVFKGYLSSRGSVAVKRFDQAGIECARNPFITEFATMVCCLRHENLVQLQGWCCEGTVLALVYEYLPNGSLNKVLHKNSSSAIFLLWKQRLNIVLGLASALSYLHEECERQIIHRDVKACNILLDAEFNAKLGDFGLAEVYEHSSVMRAATIPAGTSGYLAPEYVYSGVPSVKSDVYSFGVVMLEVATGKRPVDDVGAVLVDRVWSFWEKGKLIGAADSKLVGMFNTLEVERMLMVGLSCVQPNHEKRPTVKEAAMILRGEAPLPVLPWRKPAVGFQSVLSEDSDETMNLTGDNSPCTDDVTWMTPRTDFG